MALLSGSACSKHIAAKGNDTELYAPYFQELFEDDSKPGNTVESSKEYFNSCPPAVKEVLKKACKNFMALSEKNKDEKVLGDIFCCKAHDICPSPFYTEIWFFSACGGFVLLLIIIILIVIICCKK